MLLVLQFASISSFCVLPVTLYIRGLCFLEVPSVERIEHIPDRSLHTCVDPETRPCEHTKSLGTAVTRENDLSTGIHYGPTCLDARPLHGLNVLRVLEHCIVLGALDFGFTELVNRVFVGR